MKMEHTGRKEIQNTQKWRGKKGGKGKDKGKQNRNRKNTSFDLATNVCVV
jgi:hypothetical protein